MVVIIGKMVVTRVLASLVLILVIIKGRGKGSGLVLLGIYNRLQTGLRAQTLGIESLGL